MTTIDAIARKGNNFFLARFVRRSRSSQAHLGFFNFTPVSRKAAQAQADRRGLTEDAAFLFDGYRLRWLAVKEQI